MSNAVLESRRVAVQNRPPAGGMTVTIVPPKRRAFATPRRFDQAATAGNTLHLPGWYRSDAYEFVNALTHGAGLALSLIGALVMGFIVAHTGDVWRILGCGIFVASMIAVYAASTLSHSGFAARWRTFLRRLDQGVIYFLVVATYTPFGLAYLRTGAGWLLLAALWTGATAGFLSKFFLSHKLDANLLWTYVVLGALPTMTIPWLWNEVPVGATFWMFLGGICYLLGTLFLVNDWRVRHFHALWHVLVIAGSACHFLGILSSVASAG
jgi:hemolysin III